MTRYLLNMTLAAMVVVTLSGCSSLGKKAPANAAVENGGISNGEMNDIDAARSRGLKDGAGAAGANALNDPKSPLSTRIIYFDYDSTTIRSDFGPIVQAHASYLAAHPGTALTLEGHTDERGTPEYNLALGERRAMAVRRQLVLLGANAGQVKTVSYGKERPVAEGHDEASYGKNRRVELVYP